MNNTMKLDRRKFVLKSGLLAGATAILNEEINATDASLTGLARAIGEVDNGSRKAFATLLGNSARRSGYQIIPELLQVVSTYGRLEVAAPLADACSASLDQLPFGIPLEHSFLYAPKSPSGLPAGLYTVILYSDQIPDPGTKVVGFGTFVAKQRVVAKVPAYILRPVIRANSPSPRAGIILDATINGDAGAAALPQDIRYFELCDGTRFCWDLNSPLPPP